MELKRRIRPELVFISIYILMAVVYFWVGFQPAGAKNYDVAAVLNIPSIGLTSDVTELRLEDHRLETPDTIVGSYESAKNKNLLIGHSSTVFADLHELQVGDLIYYGDKTYSVAEMAIFAKEDISMRDLLKASDLDTLVIMTCAGQDLGGGDSTHRLIVTATVTDDVYADK